MSRVKDVDNKKAEKDEARFAQILRMEEEDKIKKEAMGEHLTGAYAQVDTTSSRLTATAVSLGETSS
uniref:Uncharacterized protein n=1 Tax=Vespula pensylvanica TaxID=30213 RepID=A0A834UBS6_VESPE|nr:hypothetical protein H0235_005743 [Vespula pensylvanica]